MTTAGNITRGTGYTLITFMYDANEGFSVEHKEDIYFEIEEDDLAIWYPVKFSRFDNSIRSMEFSITADEIFENFGLYWLSDRPLRKAEETIRKHGGIALYFYEHNRVIFETENIYFRDGTEGTIYHTKEPIDGRDFESFIVSDNHIIFNANNGGERFGSLELAKNGFYFTNDFDTSQGFCCPKEYTRTYFDFINGRIVPLYEKRVPIEDNLYSF